MKPTDFSHDALRFQLSQGSTTRSEKSQMIAWKFVEDLGLKAQLTSSDDDLMRDRYISDKNLSPAVRGTCARGKLDAEMSFGDQSKLNEADDFRNSWSVLEPSRSLKRSRSMIRTNPWVGPTGDTPPRSPECRCRTVPETGTTTTCSPRIVSRVFDGPSAAMTSSIDSDSLYQSMTSDTDAATSSDFNFFPRDVPMSDDALMENYSSSDDTVYGSDEFTRQSLNFENFSDRSSSSDFSPVFERPDFGTKRFQTVINKHDAKAADWQNWNVMEECKPKRILASSRLSNRDNSEELDKDKLVRKHSPKQRRNIAYHDSRNDHKENKVLSSSSSSCSLQFRKKIQTVRSSLQEKVLQLNREKKVVDEKIREAKEEERLRLCQLEKFRQQLHETRKEILLRTLDELRQNLHEQSLKLQKLYDIVLGQSEQMLYGQ